MNCVIGIDPGSRVGVAVLRWGFHKWHLSMCHTYGMEELDLHLVVGGASPAETLFVIEEPPAGIFPRAGCSARAMLKIARNVGQCAARADEIRRRAEAIGFSVRMIPPIRGGTKRQIPPAVWRQMWGWNHRTPSNHARDASMLAWRAAKEIRP